MDTNQPASHAWAAKLFALALIGLAGYTVRYSLGLKMYTSAGPGAGLFPLIIGTGLGITALLWLAQLLLVRAEGVTDPPGPGGLVRVGLQVLVLLLFVVLIGPVGYVPSAIVLVVGTGLIAGERNWAWLLLVAAMASFGIRYLFGLLGTYL